MFNKSRQIYTLAWGRMLKNYGRTVVSQYLKVFHIPSALESTFVDVAESTRCATSTHKINNYAKRSHNCGELTLANVGERVELVGWIQYQRMSKFIVLRDAYGLVQLFMPDDRRDLRQVIEGALCESVIRAVGVVEPRPKNQINPEMKSGEIEVALDNLEILSSVEKQLPFEIRQFNKAKEQLRMQYRYLDLRFSQMQKNLRLRSKVSMKMREFLVNECDFVDVETPTLFRRTPGGAQEFVVPTQHPNKFYSLVQSPQQFKQLLMIGGIDRYFQVARCYRDEGSRSDRQPEFTQLDIEMSFVDQESIMCLTEDLILNSWPEELGTITVPFQRMSFEDAMELYGSDKPDLRIPYKLENLTGIVRGSDTLSQKTGVDYSDNFGAYAIVFPNANKLINNATKKEWNELAHQKFSGTKIITVKVLESSWKTKLNALLSEHVVNDIETRLNLRNEDVLFLAFGKKPIVQELLGTIRILFTNLIESKGTKVREDGFKFLWILDFPLFSKSELDGSLQSTHHPFTQPRLEDFEFLSSKPLKVRGLHYDLVLNGSEIAGGSIRVHDAKLQRQIMDMLNIDSSQMSYLLEALSSGAPPHGGIALGLDRYISILCCASSIREVIAFPKTMEGRDLMSGAPVAISQAEKSLYHIKTTEK